MNAPETAAPPELAPPATATLVSFSQSTWPLRGSGTSGTSGMSVAPAFTDTWALALYGVVAGTAAAARWWGAETRRALWKHGDAEWMWMLCGATGFLGGSIEFSRHFGAIAPLAGNLALLFEQVRGRTNLFYYDWEITQARLVHGKQFYQLLCGATGRHVPSTNTAAQRWIAAVGPKLTNTVTEITQAGPQELSLVRRSPIGFTGFELATLATLLDSPAFPFRLELPPIFPWTVTNSTAYRLAHSQVKGNAIPPAPRHPAGGSTNAPALKR